jgi:ActR/RegA family two-component response regulator
MADHEPTHLSASGVVVADRRRNHRSIVVIIHHHPETLERIAVKLEREGYHVLTAEDSKRGIDLVGLRQPAAVVSTLHLQDGNAWAVCVFARAQLSDQAPVILLNHAGLADRASESTARLLGVSILNAPAEVDDSQETFDRLLQQLRSCAHGSAAG